MNDMMTFPDTVEEFMEQYKVVDTDHVYTNGTEFVPIFRMKQWFEHIQAQPEIIRCKDCKHFNRDDVEEYTPYGFYNTYFHAFCDKHWDKEQEEYIDIKLDDYCSFAERRTDER